jgi:hypothetical protein
MQTPEEFFAGHPVGLRVHERVHHLITDRLGVADVEVRVSKSQVAFRRARGFAYLWLPGQYQHNPRADVVLSIGLDRRLTSPRFKEVVHPDPGHWMHHLEVHGPDDVDDEVVAWLRDAATAAAAVPPAVKPAAAGRTSRAGAARAPARHG